MVFAEVVNPAPTVQPTVAHVRPRRHLVVMVHVSLQMVNPAPPALPIAVRVQYRLNRIVATTFVITVRYAVAVQETAERVRRQHKRVLPVAEMDFVVPVKRVATAQVIAAFVQRPRRFRTVVTADVTAGNPAGRVLATAVHALARR